MRFHDRKIIIVNYNSSELVIKKRNDFYGNENPKITPDPECVASSYGDRFIPRRYALKGNETNKKFHDEWENVTEDVLKWDIPKNYWSENNYRNLLNEQLSIKERRILKLTDSVVQSFDINSYILQQVSSYKSKVNSENSKDWSCRPRNKPIAQLETTHDLDDFPFDFDSNMIDWSITGEVATCSNNEVVIWKDICNMSISFSVHNMSCIAYCPKGEYLALSYRSADYAIVELWLANKFHVHVEIIQRILLEDLVVIQCLEWSTCGKFLVCGSNKGVLYVLSVPKLERLRDIQALDHPVSKLRFSPKMRFLASSDTIGNIVIVDWIAFEIYFSVSSKNRATLTFDWHPWNGVELAISQQMPASIVLLNVPSKKINAFYRRSDESVRINSLIFNKTTAELLVSISREINDTIEFKVQVLASLNRLVDDLTMEIGAYFVMWNPEGTKVLTAGTDNSFSIWNLFGKQEQSNNQHSLLSKSLKKKGSCTYEYGSQFRFLSTIR